MRHVSSASDRLAFDNPAVHAHDAGCFQFQTLQSAMSHWLADVVGKIKKENPLSSSDDQPLVKRFKRLSDILQAEQRKLLTEAAECDDLPNKNILRQIAELELNIAAVENNLADLQVK